MIEQTNILDITGDEIGGLKDDELRELICRLCEAELSSHGLPTAGVICGGHQDAADGGIDVRVKITDSLPEDGFIPRPKTGFQVKKSAMPPSKIEKEMKPKGELRPAIKELADLRGAYIIVSGQSSASDSWLEKRIEAMRKALSHLPNALDIEVDFYDCGRIATWVRSHPIFSLWVKEKLKIPTSGWRTYGNWANCPSGIENEYLADDAHQNLITKSGKLSVREGIQAICDILQKPQSSVRLIGLSGVGKTRLLQALFDERVGHNPLNKLEVIYTDMGDNPKPEPQHFVETLRELKKPAILAVDNCSPELHRNLTSACVAHDSLVSLITVEYDLREDQPEETDVFRLEPASIELTEKIIKTRFDYISLVDARTLSKSSDGNVRMAIALAQTVEEGDDLSSLRDEDLLKRLFLQRHEYDEALQIAAEVCSLVYSFECNTDNDLGTELPLLASLAGMDAGQLYRKIAELKRRELIQQRGIWRALLPHAIANRLAQRALENIPLCKLHDAFEQKDSTRILKSFSRRLSYLHQSREARKIAKKWLSDDGFLSKLDDLNELEIEILGNISLTDPEMALSAIEKTGESDLSGIFLSKNNPHYVDFTRLLRSLAYDKFFFIRCAHLLCVFSLSEKPGEEDNSFIGIHSARGLFKSLFYMLLSGTHATAEQRLSVISGLLKSDDGNKVDLGFELLGAALKSGDFSSYYSFEFGAHSRNYGFQPNRKEIKHWYKLFIDISVEYSLSGSDLSPKAKRVLADNFQELWTDAVMFDELESATKKILKHGFWKEAYVAIKRTLKYDTESMGSKPASRLKKLAELASPKTLVDKIRLYVLSNDSHDVLHIEYGTTSDGLERAGEMIRSLGKKAANDKDGLNEILDEILSFEGWGGGGGGLRGFGRGLADGCNQPIKLWNVLKEKITLLNSDHQNLELMQGFLYGISEKNRDISDKILDDVVGDAFLKKIFPLFQAHASINKQAIQRIIFSIKNDLSPIWLYSDLLGFFAQKTISDEDLISVIRLILTKKGGVDVAIKILHTRLSVIQKLHKESHKNSDETPVISDSISKLAQEALSKLKFHQGHQYVSSHEIVEIIKVCFVDESSFGAAKKICENLESYFSGKVLCTDEYCEILREISNVQPIAFLDGFLGDRKYTNFSLDRSYTEQTHNDLYPLSDIDDQIIIDWCEVKPIVRYPLLVSSFLKLYQLNAKTNKLEWTPLVKKIIMKSPDPVLILNECKSAFEPTSSLVGSRADTLQNHLCLISDLKDHDKPSVSQWAIKEEVEFKKGILKERKPWEKRETVQDVGFE